MSEVAIREPNAIDTSEYVEITPTRLIFSEDTPWEVYEAVLGRLEQSRRSLMWWIGDALAFGERTYGETYTQAVEATGYSVETVKQAASVAKRVEPCIRIHDLTWGHHQVVASLEPEDQRRWLEAAAPEPDADHPRLSVSKLRSAIKEERENERVVDAEPDTGALPSGAGWLDVPFKDFDGTPEYREDGSWTRRMVYPFGEGAVERIVSRMWDELGQTYFDLVGGDDSVEGSDAERYASRGEMLVVRGGRASYENADTLTLRDLPAILDTLAMLERGSQA